MKGVKDKSSFVGNRKSKRVKNSFSGIVIFGVIAIIMISSIYVVAFYGNIVYDNEGINKEDSYNLRSSVLQDFGAGYKNPQVVSTREFFVVATVHYGALNITFLNAVSGDVATVYPLAFDVFKWYFRIAADSNHERVIVTWMNESGCLNATFLYRDTNNGNLVKTDNFTIAFDVGTTGFGVEYGSSEFLMVWSDASWENHGVSIAFNSADPNNPSISSAILVSSDTHSHAMNFVAYDSSKDHFLVLWRNYSGITGKYNITGKILDANMNTVINDFTIANGVTDDTKYDYPSGEGGPGRFFVAYVSCNSSYEIYGTMIDSASGINLTNFHIGTSYGSSTTYYGGYVGIAFNGTNFIIDWTTMKADIVSMSYDVNGSAIFSQPVIVSATGDVEEWQDVAVNPKPNTIYFVWQNFSDHHDYGTLWSTDDYVPEFSAFLPIIAVLAVAFFVYRRKR